MIHTIAHIFRKPALSRAEFRDYYESRHARLARRTLPEFSYYRRNHVIESTDDAQCPDSFSEFGYDNEDKIQLTRAILGDGRGQELLEDELKFMDKVRNRSYPVVPMQPIVDSDCAHKYVVLVRGAAVDAVHWLAGLHKADPALRTYITYSEANVEGVKQLHWLMGWSERLPALAELQAELLGQSVPVLWSARVAECKGYPG
jgi:hypothetical protein